MLFNSYEFILGFFPVVLIAFFLLGRTNHRLACLWLGISSLFFYGWWSPIHLPLLLASISFSFFISKWLIDDGISTIKKRNIFIFSIFMHLATLAFFKYSTFISTNLGFGHLTLFDVALPIGISFYTFTQIAFLVDCWQGKVKERKFDHYLLFVTYFPHLIAGPVLHHAQMMPQFAKEKTYCPNHSWIMRGATIFILGLSKKLLIADPISEYANALFNMDPTVETPKLLLSWLGTLCYSFQLYFDFSAYSDMAIGLSLFFGIKLPFNFNSPYKSTNIIDFWRKWHISLSIFLRDYLYIPLGGNKRGAVLRYTNLFITMLLGGLWHGAGWTFILWGGLHGAYLMINHTTRKIFKSRSQNPVIKFTSWAMTFLAVNLAWVLFRAESLDRAIVVYKGMLGMNGISLPPFVQGIIPNLAKMQGVSFDGFWQSMPTQGDSAFFAFLLISSVICFGMKNLNGISLANKPYRATLSKGIGLGILFCLCLMTLAKSGPSEFLYFRF